MDKDLLLQIFNEQISGKNHAKGQRIINNDLISSLNIENDEEMIYINGNVISENLFNEYTTKVELDLLNKIVVSTYCTCMDFQNYEFKKDNYCCKHLMATFYKAAEEIVKLPMFNKSKEKENFRNNSGEKLLNILLGDEQSKEEIKIEAYINRDSWDYNISCEFRIGLRSMSSNNLYVLKDINQFLLAIYNDIPVNYGRNFTLNFKEQKLSIKDKALISFIEMIKKMEGTAAYKNRSNKNFIDGKQINIPEYLVKQFFIVIKKHRVYLAKGFLSRPFETEILECTMPVEFDLKLINKEYVLKAPGGMPIVLGSENNVFFYGTSIYLPQEQYCEKISPYLSIFQAGKVVTFPSTLEETILRKLVPNLNFLSERVTLSKIIMDKIVMDSCQFKFYFDKDGKEIALTTKVKYGAYEFNIFEDCKEKIIYRETKKETEVLAEIRALGFEQVENKFYLIWGDDYAFRFFKSEIERLQKIGEVFYSESFKGIKVLGTKSITADIKPGKYDYFQLDFKLKDISQKDTANILRAFRDNLKYYKLSNGEFLDLEQMELKKFLKLLDIVSPKEINENLIQIPKSKSIYIDEYMEENNIRYIKGKSELKKIANKLKNIKASAFVEPKDLQGTLRNYQKVGYNWFKTLDSLGFGGILGDEMGLGKTFQTIAFLLSNKGRKSLIVVPTSLVYNWLQEFEKFAPKLRVEAINGAKKFRKEQLSAVENYDVIITTYNLLKLDLENYKKLQFDYLILDEAQNIKNPQSQNALTVKKINGKRKFALTGTPIENSLMELWSIFDFVMPGYLYDEKRFSVRYHKQLKEDPVIIEDLNRLIKPFILRRRKKEVVKELPDKIEKTILVNLTDKEKKIYGTYAKYAIELIEKKVEEDEFKNSKIQILAYITKLRQLCLDPSVVMEDYNGSSTKIDSLLELLSKGIEEGHRILVFSQFTTVLKNIAGRMELEHIKYSYLDGSIPSEKRMKMVDSFNSGDNSVFLISLKAGGTGLNLTSADVVVHFDPWWNPAVEDQATDRAHRIGQKKVVEVIKLVAKGTIEEKIISLQKEKKKLIDSLLGDELSGSSGLASLSGEELVELFKY